MASNDLFAPPTKEELALAKPQSAQQDLFAPPSKDEMAMAQGKPAVQGLLSKGVDALSKGHGPGSIFFKGLNMLVNHKPGAGDQNPAQSPAQTGLEHGANMLTGNYLPQLQSAAEGPMTSALNKMTGNSVEPDSYVDARDKNIARLALEEKQNPNAAFAGKVEGGGLGTALLPVPELKALEKAGILGAAAKGALVGGAYGAAQNPGDAPGKIDPIQYDKRVANAETNAKFGGLLGLGAGSLVRGGGEAAKTVGELAPKENSAEIAAAAERLGIKPSPGMTSGSQTVQDLESSLQQSPTIAGALVRRQTKPIAEAMNNTATNLVKDQTPLSPFETGEKVKEFLSKEIEKRFSEPKRLFEDLRQYTKDIPSTEKSTSAVSRNIGQIPDVQIEGTAGSSVGNWVTKNLGKNPSADQIKTIRTTVGQKAAALDRQGGDSQGLWQIYEKLGRLEENTIKRGAIATARTPGEGETIGRGMLGQLKSAKQGWSSQMDAASDLAQGAKLGRVRSPGQLSDKINSIQSEALQEKMLPLDDVRAGEQLFKYSPETADLLRRARIRDLAQRASDGNKQLSPGGILRATKNLNPETEQMLFGKDKQSLGDLRTVNADLPDVVGPSGTPKGMEVQQSSNPLTQGMGLLNYGLYKTMGSQTMQGIAKGLLKNPEMEKLAAEAPEKFDAIVLDFAKRKQMPPLQIQKAADKEKKADAVAGY